MLATCSGVGPKNRHRLPPPNCNCAAALTSQRPRKARRALRLVAGIADGNSRGQIIAAGTSTAALVNSPLRLPLSNKGSALYVTNFFLQLVSLIMLVHFAIAITSHCDLTRSKNSFFATSVNRNDYER